MLRLLHTADIHMGAPFRMLGEKGREVRKALRETFGAIFDLAREEKADLILIAGDLFDSNQVSADLVDFAASRIRGAKLPVCLLPGTHDCFEDASVYRNPEFRDIPNLHILCDDGVSKKVFTELDLTVHGRANLSNRNRQSPLVGIARNPATRWNVSMAHGSIRIESKSASDDFPIALEEIENSGMDYIALGHWHTPQDYSRKKTAAWYCGSPENIGFDSRNPAGQALMVTLSEEGVRVEPKRTGRYEWRETSMDAGEFADEAALVRRLREFSGPKVLLRARLTGLAHLEFIPDEGRIVEELAGDFLHVALDTRAVHLREAEIDPDAWPENTVAGGFLRIMQEKMGRESDEKKKVVEEALQVGLALLRGKDIL